MSSVQNEGIAVEKLITRTDNLEAGFGRIAERPSHVLSSSRLSASRGKLTDAIEQVFQELAEQLRETQETHADQERLMQQERMALQAEIHQLHRDILDVEDTSRSERERANVLERDLHQAKAQIESEIAARRILERRNLELSEDLEEEQQSHALALSDAANQVRAVEVMRQELSQVRSQVEEMKALGAWNVTKVTQLVDEQVTTLQQLDEALAGEGLRTQIWARAECEDVNRVLKETNTKKNRLQATEHDRVMRGHIAEPDGDQFSEMRAQLEDTERQLKEARSQTKTVSIVLREELQRVEHELRGARDVERILKNDLEVKRACQSDYEDRLENEGRLVAQMLDVAIAFRNSHCKAHSLAHGINTYSIPPKQVQGPSSAEAKEPCPIDPSDPLGALETLHAFDHGQLLEAVSETGSIIRKWQKQCKEYRERAKGKISFRNFAEGDLAFFRPARNSISTLWEAFSVSSPHYFLPVTTSHLAEQLKTREWMVARITSITERVVGSKDPSNPYCAKYYTLEVEDWKVGQTNKQDPETERKAESDPASL